MGVRNVLIEGVSGSGKTSVCHELRRRGQHAINADNELAYRGDPASGRPVTEDPSGWSPSKGHAHHLWPVERVRALVADRTHETTFFCGGSRNFDEFIDLFDRVFVLTVDPATLTRRLESRPAQEFGGRPAERELILRLHRTGEDTPAEGIMIDATAPLTQVVEQILRLVEAIDPDPHRAPDDRDG